VVRRPVLIRASINVYIKRCALSSVGLIGPTNGCRCQQLHATNGSEAMKCSASVLIDLTLTLPTLHFKNEAI